MMQQVNSQLVQYLPNLNSSYTEIRAQKHLGQVNLDSNSNNQMFQDHKNMTVHYISLEMCNQNQSRIRELVVLHVLKKEMYLLLNMSIQVLDLGNINQIKVSIPHSQLQLQIHHFLCENLKKRV